MAWRTPVRPANDGAKSQDCQASIGFFDLAIAAPSIKAALEIWSADSNLSRQGFCEGPDDPDVVAAGSSTWHRAP